MTKNDMLEIFDEIAYDGVLFLEEDGKLDISSFSYKEKEPSIESHELGLKYHLVTYRDNGEEIDDFSSIEAIIGDPHHYISHLIRIGFRGLIAKKTANSASLINEMAKNFC